MSSSVSFCLTDKTPDVRFLASLSDGRTVIQDPGTGKNSAWNRLKNFLAENKGISVTCLRLQAPGGHDIAMPSGQKGYFFGNKSIKIFPGGEATYIGVGYYDGKEIMARWFNIKDFSDTHVETRTKEKAGFFLIENKNV